MYAPITVVIPNYNGAHLLQRNLPSVLNAMLHYPGECFLIVVDDGSIDDSIDMLRHDFPQVKVVIHESNRGFAEAIQSGVNAADTELMFLLNSDVEVAEDIFAPLAAYFDDPNTFSVNPLILDELGLTKRHSWNLRQLKGGTLKLIYWQLENALERRKMGEKLRTAYAHGGSFMVRRSMFLMLGGFHPIFKPFYSEDYDLGLRAWRRGWASYFEPCVHIVHQSKGSIRSNVKFNYVKSIRRRNRYFLEWAHLTRADLLLYVLPASVLQLLGELLTFDTINLRGFAFALAKIKEVLSFRRELQKTSLFSLREVLKQLK